VSPVSDLDLEQIKSRIEKAAAGPWTAHADGLVWAPRAGDPVSASIRGEDAEFIATARAAMPLLVAELERYERLYSGESFPTSDGYEAMAAALTDLRGLLVEILRHFPPVDDADLRNSVRSGLVPEVTVARWRRIAGVGGG
jgi:hypothetical protein